MASPTLVAIGALGVVNGASGTNGAITVPVPTGVLAGDTLVTIYTVGDSGKSATLTAQPPAGWSTPATSGVNFIKGTTAAYSWLGYVSARTATGSEPASYSFAGGTINGGAYGTARMVAFRGGSGLLGQTAAAFYTSGATFTLASLTPTTASDTWLGGMFDYSSTTAPTNPTGFTSIATGSNSSIYTAMRESYKALSSASATGTATSASNGGFNTGSDQPGFAFSIIVAGASAPSSNTVTGSLATKPSASAPVTQSQPSHGALSLTPIVAASLAAALSVQALPSVNPGVQAQVVQAQAVSAAVSAAPKASAAIGQSQAVSGSIAALPSAAGNLGQYQPISSTPSVIPAVSGTAQQQGENAVSSAINLTPGVASSVAQRSPASGAIAAESSVSGFAAQSQKTSATALIDPQARSAITQSQSITLAGSVAPGVSGAVQQVGVHAVAATASLQPAVSAQMAASQPLNSALSVPTSASAAVQGAQAISLLASVTPGASGYVGGFTMPSVASMTVTVAVTGAAAQNQTVSATASVIPSLAGRIGNGNAYAVEPDFFLSMPPRTFYLGMEARAFYLSMTARAFYLGMPGRSFSLAMPGRSFFIQDNETMTVQTFPATIEPDEIQPLTIGKSTDLATGETLTALAGALQVEVLRGTDPSASSRFGTPQINAADIPATPPAIPSDVPVGTGLQVVCTNPLDGCWYLLRQPCTTSTGRVVTIKGIIQCTAS